MIAIVDDEDYEKINQWKWQVNSGGYAKGRIKYNGVWKTESMHRYIMNPPSDKYIDHINGNKLDNRKSNLRICTPQQNSANIPKQSKINKYKGVRYKHGNYEVSIVVNGEYKYLGTYSNEEAAGNVYNYYAKYFNGEFAYLNHVEVFMNKDEFESFKVEKKVTAKFKGVSFNKEKQKWLVRICLDGKMKFIGWFDEEIKGALAYDEYIIRNKINKQLNLNNK